MPTCLETRCPILVERGARYCPAHGAFRALYKTARWQAVRKQVLSEQPLCVDCQDQGHTTAATDVDHIVRATHAGLDRFFDRDNLAGRCHAHHAQKTARGE